MNQYYTLLSVLFCFVSASLLAQVCIPDPQYLDEPAGVYPKPDTVNGADPTIGINVRACAGESYEFKFTAIVPSEIEEDVLGTGVPLVLPLNYVKLLSENAILIDNGSGDISSFESITTLGINYECDPPDCVFNANTSGCMRLYSESVSGSIGEYTLVIRTKVNINVFGNPVELEVNFPSQPGDLLTVADGEYRLIIGEPGSCISNLKETDLKGFSFQLAPNPTAESTEIQFDQPTVSESKIRVYGMLGQKVLEDNIEAGSTQYRLNIGHLPGGIYLLEISGDGYRQSKKIQLIH